MDGSTWTNITSISACSNLCTNHPECKYWEYDTNNKCVLKNGAAPGYKVNSDPAITTYAGFQTGTAGCLQAKSQICLQGNYRYTSPYNDKQFCFACPLGKWSAEVNSLACVDRSEEAIRNEYQDGTVKPLIHAGPRFIMRNGIKREVYGGVPRTSDNLAIAAEYKEVQLRLLAKSHEEDMAAAGQPVDGSAAVSGA
jgi:hypothetical protein